ncbi:hypothetical protein [Salinirubrum litoreum]|uniref:Uncharacterized protein n=1 Tax=Salinirubrum litoreum TaxID=1126234 RepID=A0ABD5R6I2_9EURY|nr:hypothetical protein [Salinirubrum litoreum]
MIPLPRIQTPLGTEKPGVGYLRDAMGGWIGTLRDTRSGFAVVA